MCTFYINSQTHNIIYIYISYGVNRISILYIVMYSLHWVLHCIFTYNIRRIVMSVKYSTLCGVHSMYARCTPLYYMYSIQCTTYSVHYTVFSVHYMTYTVWIRADDLGYYEIVFALIWVNIEFDHCDYHCCCCNCCILEKGLF